MSERATAITTALLLLGACGDTPPADPEPRPAGLVLEFDGLRIWQREIDPLIAYAETVNRRIGRKTAIAGVLDNHLIPLRLAERAWAEQREPLQQRAEALLRAVGNGGYPELVAKGGAVGGPQPVARWSRDDLPMPIAAWAFDPEKIGTVSPVLAMPQGFSIVSTFDITAGTSRRFDVAEACQVRFYTHNPTDFGAWLEGARAAVADKVSYLHPDYQGCLPVWMKSP